MEEPRHIVIEGPMGVGKGALARRLATSLEGDLVLEKPEENPFLARFHQNPRQAALPTQLFFLFQRARLLDEIRQSDLFCPVRIADFLIERDRLFAELNLDYSEFALYEQVVQTLDLNPPRPNLVVYLQAPPDVLMRRIASRGSGVGGALNVRYLERVGDAYARFFHQYDAAPLLIVNVSEVEPVRSERDYAELLDVIKGVQHGRHYFNPAPRAIV